MILLFRFYYKTNISSKYLGQSIDNKRNGRYILYNGDKIKKFKISTGYCKFLLPYIKNNKYIIINDIYYFRFEKDPAVHSLRNICNYKFNKGQIVLKMNTGNLARRYNNHNDLYYLFYNYDEFYLWFKQNQVKFIIRRFKEKDLILNNYKTILLKSIENYFNSIEDSIILLKIKFNNKDIDDFNLSKL